MTGEIKGSGSISFRMGLSLSFQAGSGSDSVRTVPVAVLLRRGTCTRQPGLTSPASGGMP